MLVSNVKGGSDREPALGQVWQLVANVRIVLESEGGQKRKASLIRGSQRINCQGVSFNIREVSVLITIIIKSPPFLFCLT